MKNNNHEVNEKQISIAEDNRIVNAFYDAPTVITLFAPEYRFAAYDCMAVAENMMIQAWSM